jgi:hypothetical protein
MLGGLVALEEFLQEVRSGVWVLRCSGLVKLTLETLLDHEDGAW